MWSLMVASVLAMAALPDGHTALSDKDEASPSPWCAPELETLAGDVCFFKPAQRPGKTGHNLNENTLVVFLHGWVLEGKGWQHQQQRAIVRGAKRNGFSVITPRGKTGGSAKGGPQMVSWPTGMKAKQQYEAELLKTWVDAIKALEERRDRPFDRIDVVGFSNGAFYGSSLAMRAPLPRISGYGLFAGGSVYQPQVTKSQRRPVFVGICTKDKQTKKPATKLASHLRRLKWPYRAVTKRVGHTMADAHLDAAISFLRDHHD